MDTALVNALTPEVRRTEKPGGLPDLVALKAGVSNGALKGEKLPSRIRLLQWGENPSTKGTFHVGEKSLQTLATRQRELGFERVAVDFNHCSVPGSPEMDRLLKLGRPPMIFGYGRPSVVRGEGLFLEDMEWTPLGEESARQFEDLSPAVHDTAGEVDFIHSTALTTNGCLHDVTFFSATANNTEITKNMSEANKTQLDAANVITVAEMAPIVGLAATASKADVLGKLSLLSILGALSGLVKDGKVLIVETLSGIEGRVNAIEAAATKNVALLSATIDGKVVTLTTEDLVKQSARLDVMEKTLREQAATASAVEKGKILRLFAADGKAPKNAAGQPYTAEQLGNLDLATLNLLLANTPVTVPLSARNQRFMEVNGESAEGFAGAVKANVSAGKTKSQALDLAIAAHPNGYQAWREANGRPGI